MTKRVSAKDKKDRSGLLRKCADFLDIDLEKLAKKALKTPAKKSKKK